MNTRVFGKLIGGLLGWSSAGIIGAIIGIAVGHAFDRALGRAMRFGSPEAIEQVKNSFFETTFLLLGYLAKADGRVSRSEIDHTERLFVQMGLDAEQRKRAIGLFHRGAEAGFQWEQAIAVFVATCGPQKQLQQALLLFLVSLAQADEVMAPAEHAALVAIAARIGVSATELEKLIRMARAQEQFSHQGGTVDASAAASLQGAYAALGIDASASDKELKQAYRRLMSENHPDKLIARGVPEEMIKLATTRSQDIQAAYERIKKSRQ